MKATKRVTFVICYFYRLISQNAVHKFCSAFPPPIWRVAVLNLEKRMTAKE